MAGDTPPGSKLIFAELDYVSIIIAIGTRGGGHVPPKLGAI